MPPARRGRDRRLRRERAGRAGARAGVGHGGRAHPRLQHGVPPGRPARDRRLRPAVPRRRRRRRRLLAPAGAGADARLPRRRRWSGITAAAASAASGASSGATARPRRCSSASGRSATTAAATSPGRAASTTAPAPAACGRRRIYHGTWGTGAFQPEEPAAERPRRAGAHTRVVHRDWRVLDAARRCWLRRGAGRCSSPRCWPAASACPVAYAVIAGSRADLGRHGLGCAGGAASAGRLPAPGAAGGAAGRPAVAGTRAVAASRVAAGLALPRTATCTRWYEHWQPAGRARRRGSRRPRARAALASSAGGAYDRWDLEIRGGAVGGARMLRGGRGARPRPPAVALPHLAVGAGAGGCASRSASACCRSAPDGGHRRLRSRPLVVGRAAGRAASALAACGVRDGDGRSAGRAR